MNLSSKHLQQLLKKENKGTHLSIYMPTHPSSSSQTMAQDTTRFKNALKKIKSDSAYDERELGETLKSLYKLVDDIDFWKRQDIGLALFANKDGFDYCHLPYETTEGTYIENRFIISPLAIMHSIGTEFYVLDINLTKPRLMKSNHGTLVSVDEANIPGSFQETIAGDEYKMELQNMPAPRGSGGDNRIHGHSPEDAIEHATVRYLTNVADAVNEFLVDSDQPLLLVGEQSRVGNLRPFLKYEYLLSQSIDGNYEMYNPQDLYDLVIETMQDHETQQRRVLIEQIISSDPELVVTGNKEIIKAALAGRVEQIYVPAYRRTKDSVRTRDSRSIVLQLPEEISELESVIRDVLLQAGSVVAVEIGAYSELTEIKALCRF